MQDSDIPWCISNIKSLVSALAVQYGTTQVLDGVVGAKLEVSNVLVPVLESNTSILLQKCVVILCFWFLREYVLWQDVVCGDHVNSNARGGGGAIDSEEGLQDRRAADGACSASR